MLRADPFEMKLQGFYSSNPDETDQTDEIDEIDRIYGNIPL